MLKYSFETHHKCTNTNIYLSYFYVLAPQIDLKFPEGKDFSLFNPYSLHNI